MKLWRVPDGNGEAAYNLESFLGLELEEWHQGAVRRWRVLGVLNGSRLVLFEGSREKAEARFEEALGILTGDHAPYGVAWLGPADVERLSPTVEVVTDNRSRRVRIGV